MKSNPYQVWLANPEQPLPMPYDRVAAQEVWEQEYATHLETKRALEARTSYANFHQWLGSKRRIATLTDILWVGNSIVAGADEQLQKKFYHQVEKQYEELLEQEYRYRARLGKLERRPGLSASRRALVAKTRREIYRIKPDALDQLEAVINKRREEFLANHPGMVVRRAEELRGVEAEKVESAGEKAKRRGRKGFLVERSGVLTDEIIEQCRDRETREKVWEMTQEAACISDRSTRKVFAVRKQIAKAHGFQSFSQHELAGCLQSNPKTISRNLRRTLEHSASLYNQYLGYLGKLGRQQFGIKEVDEWDTRFLENKFNEQHCGRFPTREFPWEATMLQAVPELLKITGWRALMVAKRGKGKAVTYTWRLERRGKVSFLTIVPFQINEVKDLFTKGFAIMTRAGTKNTMHAVVQLLANPKDPGFDLMGLETLAHEIGHVMHWLALPSKASPGDSPGDFTEVPSTLLEQYPRDTKVLARWSKSQKAESYWHQFDQYDTIMRIKWLFTEHYSSWLNLVANGKKPPKSLKKFIKQSMEDFGVTDNTRGSWWADKLMHLDEGVAGYIYPFAYALNNRLYGKLETADPEAAEIARVYRRMEKKVLRHTHLGPQSIKKYWKEMTGETLLQSLKEGEKSRLARITRQAKELGQEQARRPGQPKA